MCRASYREFDDGASACGLDRRSPCARSNRFVRQPVAIRSGRRL